MRAFPVRVGEQPVDVQMKPVYLNPQERIFIGNIPDGTGTHLGPSQNEVWEIESIQYELQTSPVAGLRGVWFYFTDGSGNQQRFGMLGQDAGQVIQVVLKAGMPFSTTVNTIAGQLNVAFTGPYYVDRLEWPAYFNVLPVGGQAADVRNIAIIIRRVKQ